MSFIFFFSNRHLYKKERFCHLILIKPKKKTFVNKKEVVVKMLRSNNTFDSISDYLDEVLNEKSPKKIYEILSYYEIKMNLISEEILNDDRFKKTLLEVDKGIIEPHERISFDDALPFSKQGGNTEISPGSLLLLPTLLANKKFSDYENLKIK